MQNKELSKDYIKRAEIRLKAIEVLLAHQSYADVVREAQEVVELALKAMLRQSGIEPPRIHDVSAILLAEKERIPSTTAVIERLAKISKSLRRDRELAFYGSEDLTPSQFYGEDDAKTAFADAQFTVSEVRKVIPADA